MRPHERSLEPLTQTERNETMMDNPGDHDVGEDQRSQIKKSTNEAVGSRDCYPPAKHVVTIRIAIGAALVLLALGCRTHSNKA